MGVTANRTVAGASSVTVSTTVLVRPTSSVCSTMPATAGGAFDLFTFTLGQASMMVASKASKATAPIHNCHLAPGLDEGLSDGWEGILVFPGAWVSPPSAVPSGWVVGTGAGLPAAREVSIPKNASIKRRPCSRTSASSVYGISLARGMALGVARRQKNWSAEGSPTVTSSQSPFSGAMSSTGASGASIGLTNSSQRSIPSAAEGAASGTRSCTGWSPAPSAFAKFF